MSNTVDPDRNDTGRTLLVAFAIAAGFLLWGLFIFFTVGVKAPAVWDFGAVPDVPGLSAYSTVANRPLSAVSPFYLHEQAELSPQHVRDRPVFQGAQKKELTP